MVREIWKQFVANATVTHIAKPHQPARKPKLGKECVCPTLTDGRKRSMIAQQWLYVMRAKVLMLK